MLVKNGHDAAAGDVGPADLTLRQAATLAGCSVKTLRRAIHAGDLPGRYASTAHGAQLILPYADVERWIAQRQAPATSAPTVDTRVDISGSLDNRLTTVQDPTQEASQAVDTGGRVQQLLQEIVAPLTAEIARLNDLTRAQAEELGALRERERVYTSECQKSHGQAAPLTEPTPASPTPEATTGRPRPSRWEKARAALIRALS